jgi:hypothetical protein
MKFHNFVFDHDEYNLLLLAVNIALGQALEKHNQEDVDRMLALLRKLTGEHKVE